ncbi:uncharacterized protein TNCV_4870581 [Trichonephila clavipes]|nr:uncharacterized protein TNCV_4870581 [Trichonephila clavipes]
MRNRDCVAIVSMVVVVNTRPLPGHSIFGHISTRKHLHSGVLPPTTESSKGGSGAVIWQKPGMALTWSTSRICYSIRVRIEQVNPTPFICSTNPIAVSLRGHQIEVSPSD